MGVQKVWYAITGSTDGHGDVIAVGHSYEDLLEELLATRHKFVDEVERNDQNYISIQYAELKFGIPERR